MVARLLKLVFKDIGMGTMPKGSINDKSFF